MVSEVRVAPGEPIERAIKRWKKACDKAGLLTNWCRREQYVGPGERRRKKSAAACKRLSP